MSSRWLLVVVCAAMACDGGEAAEVPVVASGTTPAVAPPTASATATASAAAAPTASAAPEPPKPEAPPEGMVKIPAGIFLMGALHMQGNPEERPAHEAIVASFFLDATEVTVADYMKCVAAGGCKTPHGDHRFCNHEMEGREKHPVNCVDLKQASAYCAHAGKRLPAEREWEYAASNGSERRRFSWGNDDPVEDKNSCYHHPFGSCEVAQFPAGAFGLFDMTGNVWEWTQTRFEPYPSAPLVDPIEDKKLYVYRGGSWSRRFPKWMRNHLRNRYKPHEYSASIGFRCAKTPAVMECPPETAAKDGYCQRVTGDMTCEPGYTFRAEKGMCLVGEGAAALPGSSGPAAPASSSTAAAPPRASVDPAAPPVISRSRTAQHDADCQKNWPKTPHSYLFSGGENYPSRKPIVAAAGCVPRDMGWSWTSACCK